jgi:sugar lactone lactonase YvrE
LGDSPHQLWEERGLIDKSKIKYQISKLKSRKAESKTKIITMIIFDLIKKYRQSINPPYRRKDAVTILVTVVILLAIPLTVFSILTSRSLEPKAAPAGPPRGVEGDLWADVIIGKRDFSEITPNEVFPDKLFIPFGGGVVVDKSTSPGRLYVWDGGNSRILGIDLAKCYAGSSRCSADFVIGQPSASDYSACNGDGNFQNYPNRAPASDSTLCGLKEGAISISEAITHADMFVDTQGNLYVPDQWNNRVLKFNTPFTSDKVADEVWGQVDFTGNLCNRSINPSTLPTAYSLCFEYGGGVAADASGNLWIGDAGNHRILRFPKDPGSGQISKTADLVLGQKDFTSRVEGRGLDGLDTPQSLAFDASGKLYVADRENNRVLVYAPPFTTGMSASSTFGTNLRDPGDLAITAEGVWISENGNGMVELWDFNGTTVKKVIGKSTYNPDGTCQLCEFGSLDFDAAGNLLLVRFQDQDIYRYSAPIASGVINPDKKLFSPPTEMNLTSNRRLATTHGVAIAANQLIVSDGDRVLFWNNPTTLTNGEPADGFVGVRDFRSQSRSGWGYLQLKSDNANRVWLSIIAPEPQVRVYQAPLSIGSKPIKTIKFPINVLGGGQITANEVVGIAPTPDGKFLWVSQVNNNRVFRIRDPLTNPLIDVVLGQDNLTGNQCNKGRDINGDGKVDLLDAQPNSLCIPGHLSIDKQGNLYVSDHWLEIAGNVRLLMFSASLFPPNNTSVIFAPNATKIFPRDAIAAHSHSTWEPAFDSQNRMVVGYNGYSYRFVGYYNNPTGPSVVPDGYLKDFYSMPFAATFDKFDNLYIAEGNRSRIMIYKDPFNNNPSGPPDPPIPEVTTVHTKISLSSDDAFNGCWLETLGGITLGYDKRCTPAKPVTVGLRLQNLNIPKDATITNAVVSFISSNNYSDNLNLTVKGVAADNAATFSASNNPGTVPTTSAGASFGVDYPWQWRAVDWTPTLTSIVQEIVNRPLWQAGNSLAVVIADNGTPSTSHRGVDSYDISSDSAAELWVQYTAGGGPQPKPGDLNGDNQVDIYDLSILLSNWGVSGGVVDINSDGEVDIFDLSILLSNWGS